MKNKNPKRVPSGQKFGKKRSYGIIFPILFVFAVVSLAAFGMRMAEERIIKKTSAEETNGQIQPAASVTEQIQAGYLKKGVVLGLKMTKKEYQAELIGKAYPSIRIYPGKAITFWVDFKNTGTKTWYKNDEHFVALNVTEPAGRSSLFRHEYWHEYYYRPCRLFNNEVKPEEIGRFIFALQAPSQPGNYVEKFALVAENLLWIEGGKFEIPIEVAPSYQAELAGLTTSSIKVESSKALTFWVDFRNRGTATWRNYSQNFIALNVTGPAGRLSPFKHEFWHEYYYRPCRLLQSEVKPGEIGRFRFALQTPEAEGNYLEKFGLVAENMEWISGGEISIPIEVRSNNQEPPPVITYQEGEPDIRIGLYHTEGEIIIKANGPYKIKNTEGEILVKVNKEKSSVELVKGQYVVKAPGFSKTLSSYPRFVPDNPEVIMEITSFENYTDWDKNINDNKFRGIIEVRYSPTSKKLWIINELPLETYLRGLGEASGNHPKEYLKALVTAARTYAMYHIQTGGLKHKGDNFILDDSANDQIYRGYNIELRSPEVTEAVLETAGQMVTYKEEIVITPYFSHSDGRTRSWTEVWAGPEKPWLQSKPDPHCYNLNLWGHGVGMSGLGARMMALEEDKTWPEILKYYYTNVGITKIY